MNIQGKLGKNEETAPMTDRHHLSGLEFRRKVPGRTEQSAIIKRKRIINLISFK